MFKKFTHIISNQSLRLVWSKRIANAIIICIIGVCVLIGLSVAALNFLVAPRISDWRESLERISSDYLKSDVRIEKIQVDTSHIIPSFQIYGLNISNPNQPSEQERLVLPDIRLSLSVGSLLKLTFDQIAIENPSVSVIKTPQGKIRVGGLGSDSNDSDNGLDWFFSQPNIQVHHATALWLDQGLAKGAVPLNDLNVDFVNGLKSHALKLEATPPEAMGARFSIQANFKESLLSTHASHFKEWSGTSLFNFPQIDLAVISQNVAPHPDWSIQSGNGWLRVWVDARHGEINQLTTDINFSALDVGWRTKDARAQKLKLKDLSGRFQFNVKDRANEFNTQELKFVTEDENQWALGRASLVWRPREKENTGGLLSQAKQLRLPMQSAGSGLIELDQVFIKPIMNQLPNLPIDSELMGRLKNIELTGDLKNFKFAWDFDGAKTNSYNVEGELNDFIFERLENSDENFLKGLPGVRNANIKFNFNKSGGNANVSIDNGSIALSRWLEEREVPLTHAVADVHWLMDSQAFNLKINKTSVLNDDARGDFDLNLTIPRAGQPSEAIRNSLIDLNINVQEGNANQIYRYMPTVINAKVRQYLHKGITHGLIKNATIKIKGQLSKFPFVNPAEGDFHISTKAQDLTYQYVPSDAADTKTSGNSKPWPELAHLSGELVIDRKSLVVKKASTKLSSAFAPNLTWSDLSVEIADLFAPTVNVSAKGKGPLSELIKVINTTAIGELLDNTLSKTEASAGTPSEYAIDLSLPLSELNRSKITGSVQFANNDLYLMPGLPSLTKIRGALSFNESGFSLQGVKARALGSETRIDGGLKFTTDKSVETSAIKIQGTLSAEGLRQSKELSPFSKVGQYLAGQTNYLASLTFKKGQLDFELNSTLQGLSSQLPAPLAKKSDALLPLKIAVSVPPLQALPTKGGTPPLANATTRIIKTNISLAQVAWISVQNDFAPLAAKPNATEQAASLNRVWIGIGRVGAITGTSTSANNSASNSSSASALFAPSVPDPGYFVSVDVNSLDADAWESVISETTASSESAKPTRREDQSKSSPTASGVVAPIGLKIKAGELTYSGRAIHQVALDASYLDLQPSGQWHVNINSKEAKGAIDYRLASPGAAPKVFARMNLLVIPPSELDKVESLLSTKDTVMPSLDIIVDELEIKGKKLGHAEIDALNQSQADGGREWRINKLNLTVPEGRFQATGFWAIPKDVNKNQNVSLKKTTLDFNLDIDNAGQMLDRMGTRGAVSAGKGKLNGQISWYGSPMQMDYASLGGRFNINIEKGSFLKTEPGAARLLGVLNLQALPRRLFLDFKDIFSDGFSFDFFRGDISIDSGIAKTNNLQMKGVNAAIFMEGRTDISNETQNLKVIVIPEIDAGTASLVVAAINPVVGISSYLAQYFLKKPISQATTKDFLIEGTWSDPKVTKIDAKVDFQTNTKSNTKQ